MRIGDILYFSPRFKFAELNFDDTNLLVEAFRDRVFGFYLDPASRLIKDGDAFAGGLVCCASIEFVATVSGKVSPVAWLQRHIADFAEEKLADRFWNYFRNGLAHEGRVKSVGQSSGQFSLALPAMVTIDGSVMIVNPELLLRAVSTAFNAYCEQLDEKQTSLLVRHLRRYFEAEVNAAKS